MARYVDQPLVSERFAEALAFASRLHARQQRKGSGVPYVAHLLAVTATVMEHGGDEEQAIAALLHDALEDQGAAYGGAGLLAEDIERRFGARVRRIVEGCSDWSGEGERPPWPQRKARYVEGLLRKSADVRLVSAADKLHNARSLVRELARFGPSLWRRFTATPEQTCWYYGALLDAYRRAGDVPVALLEELEEAVAALHRRVREGEAPPVSRDPRSAAAS